MPDVTPDQQTDPVTGVVTIRKAAALMRETANDVIGLGHDWTINPPLGDSEWTISDERGTHVAETPDYGQVYLPDHIASWSPPVALLVADLLDAMAADIDMVLADHGGSLFGTVPAEWTAAYNLAAAYLDRNPR